MNQFELALSPQDFFVRLLQRGHDDVFVEVGKLRAEDEDRTYVPSRICDMLNAYDELVGWLSSIDEAMGKRVPKYLRPDFSDTARVAVEMISRVRRYDRDFPRLSVNLEEAEKIVASLKAEAEVHEAETMLVCELLDAAGLGDVDYDKGLIELTRRYRRRPRKTGGD